MFESRVISIIKRNKPFSWIPNFVFLNPSRYFSSVTTASVNWKDFFHGFEIYPLKVLLLPLFPYRSHFQFLWFLCMGSIFCSSEISWSMSWDKKIDSEMGMRNSTALCIASKVGIGITTDLIIPWSSVRLSWYQNAYWLMLAPSTSVFKYIFSTVILIARCLDDVSWFLWYLIWLYSINLDYISICLLCLHGGMSSSAGHS